MHIECNCNVAGSTDTNCDLNGVCNCKINVDGDKCSECKHGYFNLQQRNNLGCEGLSLYSLTYCALSIYCCICSLDCMCDFNGSLSQQCNDTGYCECRVTVQGQKCDRCPSGFIFNSSSPNLCEGIYDVLLCACWM